MRKFKEKVCIVCNQLYQPTGSCSKVCPNCKASYERQRYNSWNFEYRKRKGKPVGMGKGGNNKEYKEHPQYKNGIGYFHKMSKVYKEKIRYCERCGKNLIDSSRYFWAVHHRDHDRNHNEDSNFELLCKRCHQIEHKCWKAFEGATTILNGVGFK